MIKQALILLSVKNNFVFECGLLEYGEVEIIVNNEVKKNLNDG